MPRRDETRSSQGERPLGRDYPDVHWLGGRTAQPSDRQILEGRERLLLCHSYCSCCDRERITRVGRGTKMNGMRALRLGLAVTVAVLVLRAVPVYSALAIDPLTPTTLYAATSAAVFRRTERGVRWAAGV